MSEKSRRGPPQDIRGFGYQSSGNSGDDVSVYVCTYPISHGDTRIVARVLGKSILAIPKIFATLRESPPRDYIDIWEKDTWIFLRKFRQWNIKQICFFFFFF